MKYFSFFKINSIEKAFIKSIVTSNNNNGKSHIELSNILSNKVRSYFNKEYPTSNRVLKQTYSYKCDIKSLDRFDIKTIPQYQELLYNSPIRSLTYKDKNDFLKVFEKKLFPYHAFKKEDVYELTRNNKSNKHCITLINTGVKYFKENKIELALNQYMGAVSALVSKKSNNEEGAYFQSWILHEIGNLFFVKKDFLKARDFFVESYLLKIGLKNLPVNLLFSSQLKIIALESYQPELFNNWDTHLIAFIDHLNFSRKKEIHLNKLLIDNLYADSYFYLFNGFAKRKDKSKTLTYFKKAVSASQNCNDLVGLAKIYAHYVIYMNEDTYLNELEKLCTEYKKQITKNPYFKNIGELIEINKNRLDNKISKKLLNLIG